MWTPVLNLLAVFPHALPLLAVQRFLLKEISTMSQAVAALTQVTAASFLVLRATLEHLRRLLVPLTIRMVQ